jgi:hypothetical protein
MFTITPKLAGLVVASALALTAPAALAASPHTTIPHKSAKKAPKTHKAASKSVKAAWNFPPCTDARAEYEYIYSGDPCSPAPAFVLAPTPESGGVFLTPGSRVTPPFCNGNAEYEYVYSGCEG